MTTQKLKILSRLTAILSFAFGTIIFWTYYFKDQWQILFVGYGFIIIAGMLNIALLTAIHTHWKKTTSDKHVLAISVSIMLLNIPVLIIYAGLTLKLLNTIRLTLTNTTAFKLTNIEIKGCEHKVVNELMPGEEKEIWVGIPHDCGIEISYKKNGDINSEIVFGYATNSDGQKISYKIGTDKGLHPKTPATKTEP